MYIIGTSGHIDHGKTSLITALTGTDCDRLPEEKKRGMTIDIGFANIKYPGFGTVSIIDVPGHERFIRNMVAGTWGIDCALLVIAADDGWMPQTEDHFRVLSLLDIARVIVVLSKIDLAGETELIRVEEEIRERLKNTKHANADIIRVSAKTSSGISELKQAIEANLRKLPQAADTEKPYLVIDRVFTSKGYGTIVTGTLKNGYFNENETLTIIPHLIKTRIKRIESHHSQIEQGASARRIALNLADTSADKLSRGHIICRTNFFTKSENIIARLRFFDNNRRPKNNMNIELLMGTIRFKAKMILYDNKNEPEFTARLVFEKPCFCFAEELFVITAPGGFNIIGGGRILLPNFKPEEKKQLKTFIELTDETSTESILLFITAMRNYMKRGDINLLFALNQARLDEIINQLIKSEKLSGIGDYIMLPAFYTSCVETIREAVETGSRLNLREITDAAALPAELVQIVLDSLIGSGHVAEKDGRYFAKTSDDGEVLSENQKLALRKILALEDKGVELDKLNDAALKKELKQLVKLGHIISLDGNILYHRDIYTMLAEKILNTRQDDITISDAREASGISRKYLIPLLNRMETDGFIKRFGDIRKKL